MTNSILKATNITKTFSEGNLTTEVLKGVDIELFANEKLAIIGLSGSGKSTLLHILAGLDDPTTGTVELMGKPFSAESDKKRGLIRNKHVGFVYQFHFLLAELDALENVMLPLRVGRVNAKEARAKAKILLEKVGLSHRLHHKPSELSGGERQRVAIARALITDPVCVLADEPTGNLDEASAQNVFDLMLSLNKELNTALLIVTHDLALASKMDRQLVLSSGSFD